MVIGAGLAGLGAAWRLAHAGHPVLLLEAGLDAGGRNGGRWEEGFSIDRTLPVLSHADRHLVQWINEVGLSGALLPLRMVHLGQAHGERVQPIDPSTRRGAASIHGVTPLDGLRLMRLPRLMRRYRDRLDGDRPERAARWDDRSIADFARLYFGQSSFERFVAPETMCTFASDEHETSRVAFLLQWATQGDGRTRPGIPRGALHELPRAAAEVLDVRYGCRVTRVEPDGSGYRVHFRSPRRADSSAEADAVVVATSAAEAERVASAIVSPAERDLLRDVSYAPSIALSVALERPLSGLPLQVRVPHVEGSPLETWLAEPGVTGARAPERCGLVTAIATERFALGHAGAGDDVVEKAMLDGLERLHPRIRGLVRFTRLERHAGAVPHFQVGAYRQLERFQRVQRDRRERGRRLYFAGDYLAGPRAEHALASGLRAAAALASDFA